MRSHSSPFSDLKTAAQQQAATTAGRMAPGALTTAVTTESEPKPDSPARVEAPAPRTDSTRRPNAKRGGTASVASEIAALRRQSPQRIIDVSGFQVAVPADEAGRIVATTVQLPYELREATRAAERLTGRSYQELARLGLRLVLEQLSSQQPTDSGSEC